MRLITTTRPSRVNDAGRLGERLESDGIVGQFYVVVRGALMYDVFPSSIVPVPRNRTAKTMMPVYSHLLLLRIVLNDLTEAASDA